MQWDVLYTMVLLGDEVIAGVRRVLRLPRKHESGQQAALQTLHCFTAASTFTPTPHIRSHGAQC